MTSTLVNMEGFLKCSSSTRMGLDIGVPIARSAHSCPLSWLGVLPQHGGCHLGVAPATLRTQSECICHPHLGLPPALACAALPQLHVAGGLLMSSLHSDGSQFCGQTRLNFYLDFLKRQGFPNTLGSGSHLSEATLSTCVQVVYGLLLICRHMGALICFWATG